MSTINIKTLAGDVHVYEMTPATTVDELKAWLVSRAGIDVPRQRLIYKGKVLQDGKTLVEYGIAEGMTVHLVQRPESAAAGSSAAAPGASGAAAPSGTAATTTTTTTTTAAAATRNAAGGDETLYEAEDGENEEDEGEFEEQIANLITQAVEGGIGALQGGGLASGLGGIMGLVQSAMQQGAQGATGQPQRRHVHIDLRNGTMRAEEQPATGRPAAASAPPAAQAQFERTQAMAGGNGIDQTSRLLASAQASFLNLQQGTIRASEVQPRGSNDSNIVTQLGDLLRRLGRVFHTGRIVTERASVLLANQPTLDNAQRAEAQALADHLGPQLRQLALLINELGFSLSTTVVGGGNTGQQPTAVPMPPPLVTALNARTAAGTSAPLPQNPVAVQMQQQAAARAHAPAQVHVQAQAARPTVVNIRRATPTVQPAADAAAPPRAQPPAASLQSLLEQQRGGAAAAGAAAGANATPAAAGANATPAAAATNATPAAATNNATPAAAAAAAGDNPMRGLMGMVSGLMNNASNTTTSPTTTGPTAASAAQAAPGQGAAAAFGGLAGLLGPLMQNAVPMVQQLGQQINQAANRQSAAAATPAAAATATPAAATTSTAAPMDPIMAGIMRTAASSLGIDLDGSIAAAARVLVPDAHELHGDDAAFPHSLFNECARLVTVRRALVQDPAIFTDVHAPVQRQLREQLGDEDTPERRRAIAEQLTAETRALLPFDVVRDRLESEQAEFEAEVEEARVQAACEAIDVMLDHEVDDAAYPTAIAACLDTGLGRILYTAAGHLRNGYVDVDKVVKEGLQQLMTRHLGAGIGAFSGMVLSPVQARIRRSHDGYVSSLLNGRRSSSSAGTSHAQGADAWLNGVPEADRARWSRVAALDGARQSGSSSSPDAPLSEAYMSRNFHVAE